MIQISGGKSALWWEQKRQMSGGKCDKLGGGKSDKGKWTTAPGGQGNDYSVSEGVLGSSGVSWGRQTV